MSSFLNSAIAALCSLEPSTRNVGAAEIYRTGRQTAESAMGPWWAETELSTLLLQPEPVMTVGVAVQRETFTKIRAANGSPRLAEVPSDQDAEEFELHFPEGVSLDILTSRAPGGDGALARYLAKFGEGIQQVEFRCMNVGRATKILKDKFGISALYSATRPGADGTRINFFLLRVPDARKVLIELYEIPNPPKS